MSALAHPVAVAPPAGRQARDPADDTVAPTEAFNTFRRRARALLSSGVPPDRAAAEWRQWAARVDGTGSTSDLFAAADEAAAWDESALPTAAAPARPAPRLVVPSGFHAMAQRVVLHNDPARFDLLYRLLWRLQREPGLRHDPLDPDVLQLRQLARAVQRDAYKMRAFVRFRPLRESPADEATGIPHIVQEGDRAAAAGGFQSKKSRESLQTLASSLHKTEHPDVRATFIGDEAAAATIHVAWFEPAYQVLEAVAPWFARRFAGMRWAILTPARSVRWDPATAQFTYGPGAQRSDAPAPDAGEALWLTYYRHIFNPARLNLRLMQQHMPRRYWANLPEAAQISGLAADAQARTMAMLAQSAAGAEAAPLSDQERPSDIARRPAAHGTPNRPPQVIGFAAPAAHVAEPLETLAQLHAAVQRCAACPLAACATQAVNGRGPLGAALVLVGEQPGDQEDLAGEPFVGPAGQLLNQALAAAGLARESLFLTNAVRHFKHELRGKRRIHKTPGQRDAAACQPWLLREIDLVQPTALLALGATAARALLGPGTTLTDARGRWWPGPGGRPVRVTWHPAALLRLPEAERARTWPLWIEDLQLAAQGIPAQASKNPAGLRL
ncbi:UdgX family uracil-DNA binding protein [Ottowia testudinis]|uniref:Type-4 uracil-DNA glycosylase n=1 Tax=Ottowia testudinis TaxID=2816950 RepID=A0A975CHV0_9BURK|nr:UdgX family uracil-DNA binding protein [Ottowia testudinis]QTD43663.1 UdgX family uracil-DNA binding protein [Ottowia testudinis]